uniref:Uncharacterized protein n=1 Tax=Anguilla anguilla TaxID=7936 RepID=A0A0E9PRS9_ANGAN
MICVLHWPLSDKNVIDIL